MCYSLEGGWILQTQFPDPLECSKQTNKQNDFLFIPPIEISRGFLELETWERLKRISLSLVCDSDPLKNLAALEMETEAKPVRHTHHLLNDHTIIHSQWFSGLLFPAVEHFCSYCIMLLCLLLDTSTHTSLLSLNSLTVTSSTLIVMLRITLSPWRCLNSFEGKPPKL